MDIKTLIAQRNAAALTSQPNTAEAAALAAPTMAPQGVPEAAGPFPVLAESAFIPLMLGTEMIPVDLETRHILPVGTTGSGKSQAFYQLLSAIRKRDQPCILVDHSSEFLQRYYREGVDQIFNPFDARGIGWSPFNELRYIYDFDRIARALVPDLGSEHNQDWQQGAQHLVANVMRGLWKLGKAFRTNEALIYFLTEAPERNIRNSEGEDDKTSLEFLLQGSTSSRLFASAESKALQTILQLVGKYVQPLTYLQEGDFSMTDFVRQFETPGKCKSWLFLSYTDSSYSAIRALFSIMVSCAVQSSLELTPNRERRFYIALDEFSSLDKIDAIDDALTKLRKRGGVVIAGIQSTAQLEEKFGKVGAQILLSCFGNVLMLRVSDDETANKLSAMIGDYEGWDKSYSEGTSESSGGKDGSVGATSGVNHQKVIKRGVLPSEFIAMPDLLGFVRIAGTARCKQTIIPITDLPIVALAQITRNSVALDLS